MRLNRLLFVIAAVLLAIAFCVEVGSSLLKVPAPSLAATQAAVRREDPTLDEPAARAQAVDLLKARSEEPPRPGMAVSYLALLDGLLLFTVLLVGLSLLLPERIHGRVQGVASLVVAIVDILLVLLLVPLALVLLLLMFGLFIAPPFGTLAYLAVWGFFDRDGAAVTLSIVMFLKVAFAVVLVISQPRFIQNKGLVLLIATSLVANVVVAFLHGLVPGVMVSITDALAAIVVGILAFAWSVLMAVAALISIVRAIRSAKGDEREGPSPSRRAPGIPPSGSPVPGR
ncbi:MAG TPA: hypothetical protein VFA20_22415 [Myxococcaceae bacterium]|nr:hypothetical protein [Myxococcaceae bacterium]